MSRVVALIDGFNLYHALDAVPRYHKFKWLDYWKLASLFTGPAGTVSDAFLFTSYITGHDPARVAKRRRHATLRAANEDIGVKIVPGRFLEREKVCVLTCPRARIVYTALEEKRTDVNMAICLTKFAIAQAYDRAVLISGDSDLIPAVLEAKGVHPDGQIVNVVPIGRNAAALGRECDVQMRLKEKHLRTARLPDPFALSTGRVLRCPPSWCA